MGLFSKKTLVCERCGKEYQTRITIGAHYCDECYSVIENKEKLVSGYVKYAKKIGRTAYTEKELDDIVSHRDAILEKYRMTDGITRADLMLASEEYRKLTEDEAEAVLLKIRNSMVETTTGASYTENFYALADYEQMIVDIEDVFAVGYTTVTNLEVEKSEVLLCVLFTNDPYVPAVPVIYTGKLKFWEIIQSKDGRKEVDEKYTKLCPNLTYPVQDLLLLKKQIKKEGAVKGNVDMKLMMSLISDASCCIGLFDTKKMKTGMSPNTSELLDTYGYIPEEQIKEILHMDRRLHRIYWEKVAKRLADKA